MYDTILTRLQKHRYKENPKYAIVVTAVPWYSMLIGSRRLMSTKQMSTERIFPIRNNAGVPRYSSVTGSRRCDEYQPNDEYWDKIFA